MAEQPETISLKQAIEMVGTAIYGDAWIDQLTQRERWLLDRYTNNAPPALRSEIEQAKDRHEWKLSQYRRVSNWLVQHGMNVRFRKEGGSLIIPRHVEKQLFERAFEAEFSTRRDRRLNEAGSETRRASVEKDQAPEAAVEIQAQSEDLLRRPGRVTKEAAFRRFLAEDYPDGITPGLQHEELARAFTKKTKAPISARTVQRVRTAGY